MTFVGVRLSLLVVSCGVLIGPGLAGSAENEPAEQAAAAPAITDAEIAGAKEIFGAQCGWCHGSFGMTPDKGPRLAGTQMTERQVQERIRNGKPGYMPSFHRFLNEEQIALMAKYVKSLKPVD